MSVVLRMDLSYSQMYAAVIFDKSKQTKNKQTNKQKRQNTGILSIY